jgi:hypothetical protein
MISERASRRAGMAAIVLVGLIGRPAVARGQPPAGTLPRERVHPELVDSTWGRRTAAAWRLAFARNWKDARSGFDSLHREQPVAIEPLIGLGFVARGRGNRAEARRWLRAALEVDPSSADARTQLTAIDWDRPSSVSVSIGTARVSGSTVGDWSAGFSAPLVPRLSINAQAGQITAGDPFTGIFLDSASGGGVRATFTTGGLVVRPGGSVSMSVRATRWSAPGGAAGEGEHHDYAWVEAATRVNSRLTVHVGGRPVSGIGAPQVSGGVDLLVAPKQVATAEILQGARDAPFEARTAVRLFYGITPSVRGSVRLALVREIDDRNSATTVGASSTWYAWPTFGVRAGLSLRRGAFARSAADVGAVVRW